ATLVTSALAAGTHSISAVYAGNSNVNGSASATRSLNVAKANTTTALSSSLTPSSFGNPVTFKATVKPVAPGGGTPTGTVQFKDGSFNLGAPQPLSSGVATLTTSSLGP